MVILMLRVGLGCGGRGVSVGGTTTIEVATDVTF
jgi:hypothetical protein